MTVAGHIEAARFTAWTLALFSAGIAAHYVVFVVRDGLRIGDVGRVRVAVGLSVSSLGWAIHQAYWWMWVVKMRGGPTPLPDIGWYAPVTLFAYLLVFSGSGLMISPWAERVAGRLWPAVVMALVAGLWALGYGLAKGT